jgi:hypothetical protein
MGAGGREKQRVEEGMKEEDRQEGSKLRLTPSQSSDATGSGCMYALTCVGPRARATVQRTHTHTQHMCPDLRKVGNILVRGHLSVGARIGSCHDAAVTNIWYMWYLMVRMVPTCTGAD